MLWIESGLILLAIIVALFGSSIGSRKLNTVVNRFHTLAQRQRLAVLIVFVVAVALRAMLLPWFPIPEPLIHDEFSYLLAADTFSHGRVTNPAHPMWAHFESFGIIQKPTYQSVAQPAQGLILGAAQFITGHPFWGVMFGAACMSAAICWMLQAWISPGWALIGGLVAMLRLGTLSYWGNSYWGGAIGAAAGALVLGALPRIKHRHKARYAIILAIGLAMLANNRPYEGFIFSIPVALVLFAWILGKQRPGFTLTMRSVVLPIIAILGITAVGMGYYCWKVTGNATRMPYQMERKTYAAAPFFVWQTLPNRPVYQHAVMQRMYVDEELQSYNISRTVLGPMLKAYSVWSFYWGPALSIPILLVVVVLPYGFSWQDMDRGTRFLLVLLLVMAVGVALESFFSPHYASPFTCVLIAVPLLALKKLCSCRWRTKPTGEFLVAGVILTCVITFALRALAVPLHINIARYYAPAWYQRSADTFGRAALETRLTGIPGQHLVIVRYSTDHEPFEEWVYNEANIDRAKVIWARDMGSAGNQDLINYFGGRQAWLLEPDKDRHALLPYSSRSAISSAAIQEAQ